MGVYGCTLIKFGINTPCSPTLDAPRWVELMMYYIYVSTAISTVETCKVQRDLELPQRFRKFHQYVHASLFFVWCSLILNARLFLCPYFRASQGFPGIRCGSHTSGVDHWLASVGTLDGVHHRQSCSCQDAQGELVLYRRQDYPMPFSLCCFSRRVGSASLRLSRVRPIP